MMIDIIISDDGEELHRILDSIIGEIVNMASKGLITADEQRQSNHMTPVILPIT
ncbi:hypothetical protein [Lederbergia citrea]|uniref:Uncharacterized protein n=1 Tax=Lederbergia citrea TaxID=2833581 RepID=A0A942Z480_9BACI|nr:hypothetical protein [Lederbergia citrea]MBS4224353.1 hypothetical protein [Lederbergia citrea]